MQSVLFFIAGLLMLVGSLWAIVSISKAIEGLPGWNILTAHWWIMLSIGVIFCFISVLGDGDEY